MSQRRLATIRKISEVAPIENADNIERVKVDGWYCVVNKGDFQSNDLCVYFEIDSFLPIIPQFEFLAKGSKPKKMLTENGKEIEGYRLRTIKLKGQISQGLALPLRNFPILIKNMEECPDVYDIGDCIDSVLGITKYEASIPANMSGITKGSFPSFIPRTDEERVQNCEDLLKQYSGSAFCVTSKLDGTSCTIYKCFDHEKKENIFGVCGHNTELVENADNLYWKMAIKYDLKNKLPEGYAVQGEVIGEKIQSNRLLIKGQDMYVFAVYDIAHGYYLDINDTIKFTYSLGMKYVPQIYRRFVINSELVETGHIIGHLLTLVDGSKSPLNMDALQEGWVFRLEDGNEKISFKVISNQYLLKHGE